MEELVLFLAFLIIVGIVGPTEECKNTPCTCSKCKSK